MSEVCRCRERYNSLCEIYIYLVTVPVAVVLVINGIRHKVCVALRYIAFLLNIGEVFAIFDCYAVVRPPVSVENDIEVIKLILSAPHVQYRALLSS